MSSLRHNVAKKQHRERAQPAARRKWGLLEKHKDYVLRARDYHSKEQRLKLLREKSKTRNPDEFYHGMLSSKTDKFGIKQAERESSLALSNAEVLLLKTQDEGYLTTAVATEKHKIAKLEEQLAFAPAAAAPAAPAAPIDDDSDYDYGLSDEEAPKKTRLSKRARRAKYAGEQRHTPAAPVLNATSSRGRDKIVRELSDRRERLQQLERVLGEVQLQRQLMKPGQKKKIVKDDGKVVWKWKAQRKK
ncbi:small-subunit processome [Dipodascopsis tothii]|uniref:small-subunit processome n=1 Tax=Dipodascopsis tothii TaxID=44089 RepID=UPI0034CE4A20